MERKLKGCIVNSRQFYPGLEEELYSIIGALLLKRDPMTLHIIISYIFYKINIFHSINMFNSFRYILSCFLTSNREP